MLNVVKQLRYEYAAALILTLALTFYWRDGIIWWQYVLLFFSIDIISYYPGRVWNIINKNSVPPRIYYWIYNVVHNLFTLLFISMVWCLILPGNYSYIALFVHLCIDRGLLGNFPKVPGVKFSQPTIS